MEIVKQLVDIILHLDANLIALTQAYGLWVYLIVFAIIFCETGLVFMPILPGDTLLFALGALAAAKVLNLETLFVLLAIAAIAGDTVNYKIGTLLSVKILEKQKIRFIKKEYLEKTQRFYDTYGNKTIIIARFVPIVRTFAPFVAGVGRMKYGNFITYNVIGGLSWVAVCLLAGYFFGNIPVVKKNFELVIIGIIVVSMLPALAEYIRQKKQPNTQNHDQANQ